MSNDAAVIDSAGDITDSALVEFSPGTALVFGRVPPGLDLTPFSLISSEDKVAIVEAVVSGSSVLNVGGQLANSLSQVQGLVRLSPETLLALRSGATVMKSGGWNLGTLKMGNEFSNSVRWLPASGATAVGIVASLGPAIAMMAIQFQLSELSGLVRENLALTETVLKSVRHEQWAELTGLEQAVTRALDEANSIGQVTSLLWDNVAGYEANLRKQRDLFRRHVEAHSAELRNRQGHKERRQYIETSGEAMLLDLHSLLLAHKAWFEYQALRAGRARLTAADNPLDGKLLETIIDNAQSEYRHIVEQMATTLDVLNRELQILSELPGSRTLPFSGGRRSAKDVARMAEGLLVGVARLSDSTWKQPAPLVRPETSFVDQTEQVEKDLRILRWHLEADEELEALATARDGEVGLALFGAAVQGIGGAWLNGAGGIAKAVAGVGRGGLDGVEAAWRRGTEDNLQAAMEPGREILIAITQRRILVAELSEFRRHGVLRSSTRNEHIRYVRLRDDEPAGRVELDLITTNENQTWRFPRGSRSAEPVKALAALLTARIAAPANERPSDPTIAARELRASEGSE